MDFFTRTYIEINEVNEYWNIAKMTILDSTFSFIQGTLTAIRQYMSYWYRYPMLITSVYPDTQWQSDVEVNSTPVYAELFEQNFICSHPNSK